MPLEVRICVGDRVCVDEVGEAEPVALVDLVRGVRDRVRRELCDHPFPCCCSVGRVAVDSKEPGN